jgi:hypothetical protein
VNGLPKNKEKAIMRINIAVIGLLAIASLAHADTIAVTNDGNGTPASHNNNDLAGWNFTTTDPIDVTAVGIFVSNQTRRAIPTLVEDHQVGIYPGGGGANLAIATILGGAVPDAQGYAYVALTTPLTLSANTTYFIGAYYNANSPDWMRASGGAVTMAAGLTFNGANLYYNIPPGQGAFDPSSTANASNHFFVGNNSYFGPNFQFAPAGIPEPGTFWLLGLSSVCLLVARRRLARS